ncbi:hypothetical protein H9I45_00495 [Polaribacter haliotis]|uniref:Uncharacterized protein n=1 Tax=Polaribacter haliotis TaxID=1888915 RepID=A0A7L8AG12_9FLAO|nr:hypothetical protein [Polaribacter haliotis]QOD60951.1 hypothetical protein H9I45_00495 [Polaribacter haliotis]
MYIKKLSLFIFLILGLNSCNHKKVKLTNGLDKSAGNVPAYIISTPIATYYLEKNGGGLSSMLDKDNVDWIGFHNKAGSGHKGEYRGFPNAIHKQDGSYFHAMNAKTDPSNSIVEIESEKHIRIKFISDNKKWEGLWDFYPDRCDFSMIKISKGYKYWVQYEGVPGGKMDNTDFWYSSLDNKQHPITEPFLGDLPSPEWIAFGDKNSSRMLYVLHHENDNFPDNYISRPDMTVLGFGRQNGKKTSKHLTTAQTFSIGFVESKKYYTIDNVIKNLIKK